MAMEGVQPQPSQQCAPTLNNAVGTWGYTSEVIPGMEMSHGISATAWPGKTSTVM